MKWSSPLRAAVLVFMLAQLVAPLTLSIDAEGVSISVAWVGSSKRIMHSDVKGLGVRVFGDYVAVTGYVRDYSKNKSSTYLMLFRKSDGLKVRELAIGDGYLYNCISIGDRLYVAGSPLYVLDADLRVLRKIDGEYTSLAYDGKALYLVGSGWRIEKRDPVNLSLIAANKLRLNSSSGALYDVGVDPATGRIWAVGYYVGNSSKYHSLIVIFDKDLNIVKTIDYPKGTEDYLGVLYGVAFDGSNVYVVGEYGTAKFDPDGELVGVARARRDIFGRGEVGLKIACGYGYVFVIAAETNGFTEVNHIVKILDANLSVVGNTSLNRIGTLIYGVHMGAGRPVLDGNTLYVAGYEEDISGNMKWIKVYAFKLSGSGIPEQTEAGGNRFAEYAKTAAKLLGVVVAVPSAGIVLTAELRKWMRRMRRKRRAARTAQQVAQAVQAAQPTQVPGQPPMKKYSPLRYLLVPLAVFLILMSAAGIASTVFIGADLLILEVVIMALTGSLFSWPKLGDYIISWPVIFVLTLFLGGLYIVACIDVMEWSLCLIRHAVNPKRYVIASGSSEEERKQRKRKGRRPKSILGRVKNVLGTVGSYIGLGVLIVLIAAFVLFLSWFFGWRFVLSGEFFDAITLLMKIPPTEVLDVWWEELCTVMYPAGTVWIPIIALALSIKGRFPIIDKSTKWVCSE